MRSRLKAPCYIFEGTWWGHREVPQVLPYLQALHARQGNVDLSHRTFRSADDLTYWFRRIPRTERAFVYVACHSREGILYPTDFRSPVPWEKLCDALRAAKPGAIEFLHFSSCGTVDPGIVVAASSPWPTLAAHGGSPVT
jgi:hypothetical protein